MSLALKFDYDRPRNPEITHPSANMKQQEEHFIPEMRQQKKLKLIGKALCV